MLTDEIYQLISAVFSDDDLTSDDRDLLLAHVTPEEAEEYARRAGEHAARVERETQLFAAWVGEQQDQGRHERLTFGDFVRETGIKEQQEISA